MSKVDECYNNSSYSTLTKEKLMKVFDECEKNHMGIRVQIVSFNDLDIVITPYQYLENKKRYYNRAYDDNLTNIKNNKIRIVDAKPIQVKTAPKVITLFEEV